MSTDRYFNAGQGERAEILTYGLFCQRLAPVLKSGPKTLREIQATLLISRGQLQEWMQRAVAEGWIRRQENPLRFCWKEQPQQANLFGEE